MKAVRLALAAAAALQAHVSTAFWTLWARLRLGAHGATVGRRFRVRGPLRLHCHRTGRILIGDDCRIQSGFAGNPVGGNGRMSLWVGPDATLTLGHRVGLSNSTIVCLRSVTLEDEVFLGGDSKIYDTDFHSLDPTERSEPGNPGARTAPVTVHRRAFVGGHSVLLKGTTIGEASVVGAGSVVRSPVPPRQVWAGNPARFMAPLPTRRSAPLSVVLRRESRG
ncbi:MAG TPA: acyltransferase [Vicinamibacteria bacterium]|nr:acyltransferase [Vicinamibacteria bacterium]